MFFRQGLAGEERASLFKIARRFHPLRLEISIVLHSYSDHQTIADGDDNAERENGGGDASSQEMLDLEVADARLGHFHHDRGCESIVSGVSLSFCSQDGWVGKRHLLKGKKN